MLCHWPLCRNQWPCSGWLLISWDMITASLCVFLFAFLLSHAHSVFHRNLSVINLRLYCSALLLWKATVAMLTALPDLLLCLPLSLFLLRVHASTFWVLKVPDQRLPSAGENSSRERWAVFCRRPLAFPCCCVMVPRRLKHNSPESLCNSVGKCSAVCLSCIRF